MTARLRPPERVRNLAISDHGTGPLSEGVEEDVLVWREPHLAGPLTDAPVQSINFKIGNPMPSDRTIRKGIAWPRNYHRPGEDQAA